VLTEGPAEVLATVPEGVWSITRLRNGGGSLDWATAWLRMTPQRPAGVSRRVAYPVTGLYGRHTAVPGADRRTRA
jgi:hypothetical protein